MGDMEGEALKQRGIAVQALEAAGVKSGGARDTAARLPAHRREREGGGRCVCPTRVCEARMAGPGPFWSSTLARRCTTMQPRAACRDQAFAAWPWIAPVHCARRAPRRRARSRGAAHSESPRPRRKPRGARRVRRQGAGQHDIPHPPRVHLLRPAPGRVRLLGRAAQPLLPAAPRHQADRAVARGACAPGGPSERHDPPARSPPRPRTSPPRLCSDPPRVARRTLR